MADEYDDSFLFEDEPVKSEYDDSFLFDDDQPEVEAAAPAVEPEPETDTLGESLTKVVKTTPARFQRRAGGLMAIAGDKTDHIKDVFSPMFEKAAAGEEPGVVEYAKTAWNMATSLPSLLFEKDIESNQAVKQGREYLSSKGREIAESAQEEISANQANPDNPVTQFAVDVARGAIDMGPMLAAGFVTRNPNVAFNPASTGIFTAQVAGDTYIDRLEKGVGQSEAMDAVKFNILAEALPEQIPVMALLKKGTPFLKRMINSAFGEGVQESITSVLQQQYDNQTLEGMSLKDAILSVDWKQALYEGGVGMGVGGVLSIPASAADAATRKPEYDKTPFAPTHKVAGGVDAMPVTKNGQPVPDTYIDQAGKVHRDKAAVAKPVIPPSEFDGGPLDASLQVDAIKSEVMGDTSTPVARQGVIDEIYGAGEPLIDHGKTQTPTPPTLEQNIQKEIERIDAESKKPSGLPAAYEGEYKSDAPRTDSVIKPQKPSDYDRKSLQGELNKLSKESKDIEKARGGTVVENLASKGGLNIESMVSAGMDKADARDSAKKGVPFGKPLFKKTGGMTLDEAAEAMAELGVPGVMTDQGPDSNVAFELIHESVKSGEPLYSPGDESAAAEQADRRNTNEMLTQEYEAKLAEIDTYEEMVASEGQKAADEWFYRQRAAESYDVNAEVLYEGKNITADTVFNDEAEALSELVTKAIAANPELVQSESERLIDATDAEIATAMSKIIGEPAKAVVEPEFEQPHDLRMREHKVAVKEEGLTPKQAARFEPKDTRDVVTGMYRAEDRMPTLDRAKEYITKHGNEGSYSDIDLRNLGGLNEMFTHTDADKHFKAFAEIIIKNLPEKNVVTTRHGGDEMSVIAPRVAKKDLISAMDKAQNEIDQYVIDNDLTEIEHPKHTGKSKSVQELAKGTGIYFGVAKIDPALPNDDIIKAAEQITEGSKPKELQGELGDEVKTDGDRRKIEKTGARQTETRRGKDGAAEGEQADRGKGVADAEKLDEGDIAPEPLEAATAEHIADEAAKAAASPENDLDAPSIAQINANNYAKGHPIVHGINISIENPAGSKRKPEWPAMAAHYGDLIGTEGADGDPIDVFIKPDTDIPAENPIFVIDQITPVTGKFDESKVMMGYANEREARKAYQDSYTKGWAGLRDITEVAPDEFKAWLKDGDTKVAYKLGDKPAPVSEEQASGMDDEGVVPRGTTPKQLEEKPVTTEKITKKAESEASKILKDANVTGQERLATLEKFRDGTYSLDDLKEAYPTVAKPVETVEEKPVIEYPIADKGEWYGDADYIQRGGEMVNMSPDEYLGRVRPLEVDEESRENIDILKAHIETGKTLDPLAIYEDGSEDGRHRAHAAKELGIKSVPVILFGEQIKKKAAPAEKITDVGSKIGGARKDVWSGFRDKATAQISDDEILRLPLSKIFPEPNYEKLAEQGADPMALALIKSIRDEIPAKGRTNYKKKQYLEKVNMARKTSAEILDNPEYAKRFIDGLRENRNLRPLAERVDLMLELGFPASGLDPKGITLNKVLFSLYEGKKNVPKWLVDHTAKSRKSFGGMGGQVAVADTREEAFAALKEYLERAATKPKGKKETKFEVYMYRGKEGQLRGWIIGKKVGRNNIDLKQGFKTSAEAREYVGLNQDKLVAELAKRKEIPAHRKPVNEARLGEDYRGGRDVDANEFMEAFGFRGVEFGNWVEQGKRQEDINNAYDGLMDLAKLLDIPPKAISLNGELGMAFGARGRGAASGGVVAAAHYERDKIVINLTKKSGAGSLAHEWFHSLDNYFSRMRGSDLSYVTDQPYELTNKNVRPEVLTAFKGIVNAIKDSGLPSRAAMLDGRKSKPYWATTIEMAARSFESYVINKLKDKGVSNDYLANIVSPEYWTAAEALGLEAENSYPYIMKDELEAINDAYDNFFDVVETKETDQGVALYSKTVEPQSAESKADKKPAKSITNTDLNRIVGRFQQEYKGTQPVQIHVRGMQDEAFGEGSVEKDGRIKGGFYPGTNEAVLIAENIANKMDAIRVIRHEIVGHYGFRQLLNKNGEYDTLLDRVYASRDDGLKDLYSFVERTYPELIESGDTKTIADEMIARAAETKSKSSIIKRIFDEIIRLLNKFGIAKGLVSRTELNALIRLSEKNLRMPIAEPVARDGVEPLLARDEDKAQYCDVCDKLRKTKEGEEKWQQMMATKSEITESEFLDNVEINQLPVLDEDETWDDYKSYAGEDLKFYESDDNYFFQVAGFEFVWDKSPRQKGEEATAAPQTDTPAFRAWFGGSKVVDESGDPLIVYHGTDSRFNVFRPSERVGQIRGEDDQVEGMYFTPAKEGAEFFTRFPNDKDFTKEVYLSLQNPYIVDTIKNLKESLDVDYLGDVSDALKERGHDGLIVEKGFYAMGGPHKKIIAFYPEQIKSATDNIGTFDPADPNILFSRNERAGNANVGDILGMPEEDYKDKFVRLFQNSFNRIKKLQQVIEDRGGVVSDESDIYQAEELSSGKITARLGRLDKNHMKPLIAQMDSDEITIDELDQYLMAKHAPERNEYIASINDDMPDGGSGMTNAESVEIIDSFGDKSSAMEEAANRVYAVNKQTLDDLVEGGHIEQDTVNEWRERYNYYVPLKGKEGAGGQAMLGKGYSVSGAGIQTALGRGEGNLAESPTAHTFAQAESTVVRTEKTKVGQALVNLMRENPDSDFWTMGERTFSQFVDLFGEPFEGYETAPEGLIENIDYHRVSAITKAERQAAKAEGRKPVSKVVYKLDPGYKRRDDVFSVMISGKELLINIKDDLVVEQLKKMNATELNALVAGAAQVNRYLAMINTALNPEFVITNFERDFQTAMVNLSGEQSAKMAYDVAKNIPGAVRGIWQSTFDTKGQSEWREVYEEMKDAGGTIGFFGLEDIDTKVKHIQNRLDRKRGMLGASKRGIVNVRDAVLDANLSIENAARLSAYKVAKEQWIANGMPEQEAKNKAASLAKNLTVNFNRKGELAPVLNSAYLFYNASIQGSARILTALKNPRVRKIVAGIAATSFALAMYNRGAGGDDDDGIPYWDKISDYTKQTNLIIMHPDGSGEYSKIRLPYGYNVFFYAGIAMNDLMYDDNKTSMGTAMNMLSATMNAFNPIQGADLADTVTPTVLKPYFQSERNINFMGSPIKPEYPFDTYDRPESQKSFKSTNPQLKEMMSIINEATGGDETHAGLIDISPETIKHYTNWLTGGAGMFGARTLGTAVNLATGEDIDQKNIPFARTLGGKTGSHYDTQRFYDAVKEVAAVEAQLKIHRGTDKYSDYKTENMAVHKLAFHVRKYKNRIKRLRGKRDKAYADGDHDLAREYREEIRGEMMEFSQKFDNAVASQ